MLRMSIITSPSALIFYNLDSPRKLIEILISTYLPTYPHYMNFFSIRRFTNIANLFPNWRMGVCKTNIQIFKLAKHAEIFS